MKSKNKMLIRGYHTWLAELLRPPGVDVQIKRKKERKA